VLVQRISGAQVRRRAILTVQATIKAGDGPWGIAIQ